MADHGRTGAIVLERVTQRFPVPREEREFTAVQRAREGQQAHHELVRRRARPAAPEGDQRDPKLYAESFEHAREAFPPDSLVSRDGVARVSETMRAFDVVPAGMKFEPESVYDNRFVLKALGR